MPENTGIQPGSVPGIAENGVSGDIFGTPSGAAWDAAQLIFGDWLRLVFESESVVGETTTTVMTGVAGYVNFLAYVLITVIMSYVLIASVIKTAAEGKVMGNGWSTVWLPLRTFLACFLIFPIGIGNATTISFIQVAVAWLGMVGSNAADNVATFVVKHLTKSTFDISSQVEGYKVITDMTKMAFCQSGFNHGIGDSFSRPPNSNKGTSGSAVVPDDGIYGAYTSPLQYKPDGTLKSTQDIKRIDTALVPALGQLPGLNTFKIGHKGYCGDITKPKIEINGEVSEKYSRLAFKKLIEYQQKVYDNIAKPMYENNYFTYLDKIQGSEVASNGENDRSKEIDNAVSNFFNLVEQYEKDMASVFVSMVEEYNKNKDNNSNSLVNFSVRDDGRFTVHVDTDEYSKMGWAYLGAYYTLLSKSIGEATNAGQAFSEVTKFSEVDGCFYARKEGVVSFFAASWDKLVGSDESCTYLEEFKKQELVLDRASFAMRNQDFDGNEISKLNSACTGRENCSMEDVESSFSASIGKPFFEYQDYFGDQEEGIANSGARGFISLLGWGGHGDVMGVTNATNESGDSSMRPNELFISDPITFTSNLGHTIIYATSTARVALGIIDGISTAAQNVRTPVVGPIAAFTGGLIESITSFLKVVIALIYPQAATMAYFLPLLPAIIWATSFISWLLMYAEAIFNAPLAVTLMATPEGEGIAGSRMERKIAMIAALILKPTFLIVGMLLSMMILSIGFVFMNQIFWMAAVNVTWRFDPLAMIALISIWFSIITTFMHNAFKIIPSFADSSLEWFLGGIAKTFGNDLDNMTSDEFSNSFQGAEGVSSGFGKSVGIFAKGSKTTQEEADATMKAKRDAGQV